MTPHLSAIEQLAAHPVREQSRKWRGDGTLPSNTAATTSWKS